MSNVKIRKPLLFYSNYNMNPYNNDLTDNITHVCNILDRVNGSHIPLIGLRGKLTVKHIIL